jgi:hypothetical protein
MYICLLVKYPLFLSDFKDLEFHRQILEKHSNTKFSENTSRESRVVPFGQTRHEEAKQPVVLFIMYPYANFNIRVRLQLILIIKIENFTSRIYALFKSYEEQNT